MCETSHLGRWIWAPLALYLINTAVVTHAQTASQEVFPSQEPAPSSRRTEKVPKHLLATVGETERQSWNSDSLMGADDLLDITVFEAPEMNQTARISASGEISVPLLGAVPAAGLTSRELELVLQGMLRNTFMKDPHVGVFVHDLQSHPVSIVGAVKTPGIFQIRETKTLIEMLSIAGGLADDAGNTVMITRAATYAPKEVADGGDPRTADVESVDLKALLNSGESRLNLPVHPGDIIRVPRAGIVYVVGEVNKPGGFVLQNSDKISVLQALALAQGLTHTSAASQARIIRTDLATGARNEIPMNLRRIIAGKSPDQLLEPKDIVFIPNSATKSILFRGSEAALQTAAGVAIYKW